MPHPFPETADTTAGSPADAVAQRRHFLSTSALTLAALSGAGLSSGLGLSTAAQAGQAHPGQAHPGRGRVQQFIRNVQSARVFDLSHLWDENAPIAGVNPPYNMALNATHAFPADDPQGTRGLFGDNGQLSFTSEVQAWSGQHGAPSIDATGHIGQDGRLFGGVDAAAATSDARGLGRSGVGADLDVASYPTELLVNRAVLLDVARLINGDQRPLPPAFEITAAHLAAAVAAQRVSLERGDTVLIRTGWGQYFRNDPALYAGDASAGIGVEGARFLIEHGARVVGNDTLTFEVRPPVAFPPDVPQFQVFPVHMLMLAQNGINIIENFYLEEIAAAAVDEFIVIVPPLKIRGGTGSALRSFALVP